MHDDPGAAVHHRHTLRLKGYDYSHAGVYFVTICTQRRLCLFGDVVNGAMYLKDAGQMIRDIWQGMPARFSFLSLDEFIVMPNHFHAILALANNPQETAQPHNNTGHAERIPETAPPKGTTAGSLGRIVQAFKSLSTHEYVVGVRRFGWQPFPDRLWQHNYYDHVVRNDEDLASLREYTFYNVGKWEADQLYPGATSRW